MRVCHDVHVSEWVAGVHAGEGGGVWMGSSPPNCQEAGFGGS